MRFYRSFTEKKNLLLSSDTKHQLYVFNKTIFPRDTLDMFVIGQTIHQETGANQGLASRT